MRNDLYRVLTEEVIPLYYARDSDNVPRGWVELMKEAMRSVATRFSARRMVKQYVDQLYLPALRGCGPGEAAAWLRPAPPSAPAVRARVLRWYRRHRRDLPWRRTRDPYAIWVAETMLQQTRSETVLRYFDRFLRRFPTVESLARAPQSAVLTLWSGLGYYSRARNLHLAARRVAATHAGRVPADPRALRALPGVGRYTAGAVASIAFGRCEPVLDGNVARVLARWFGVRGDSRAGPTPDRAVETRWPSSCTPRAPGEWNQALMELGATVCTPRAPSCERCPVRSECVAYRGACGRRDTRAHAAPATERVRRAALVVERRGQVLLTRRDTGRFLRGLWEFPAIDAHARERPSEPRLGCSPGSAAGGSLQPQRQHRPYDHASKNRDHGVPRPSRRRRHSPADGGALVSSSRALPSASLVARAADRGDGWGHRASSGTRGPRRLEPPGRRVSLRRQSAPSTFGFPDMASRRHPSFARAGEVCSQHFSFSTVSSSLGLRRICGGRPGYLTMSDLGAAQIEAPGRDDLLPAQVQSLTTIVRESGTSPRLSVIVPAYNGQTALTECLDSLQGSVGPEHEVLVVDDASTDDTAARVEARGLRVIRLARNRGPAAARNEGARQARGDILFFVDADVALAADAIERVTQTLADTSVSATFGSYDAHPRASGIISQYRNLLHHFVHQTGNPEASTFWAGCGAVRRTTFAEVGGFDELRYNSPSIEDIELGCRLRSAGHRIVLDKRLLGTHLKCWTLRSMIRTDLWKRAIPWSRLIFERSEFPGDLNLKIAQRVSVASTGSRRRLPAAGGVATGVPARRLSLAIVGVVGAESESSSVSWRESAASPSPPHVYRFTSSTTSCSGLGFVLARLELLFGERLTAEPGLPVQRSTPDGR